MTLPANLTIAVAQNGATSGVGADTREVCRGLWTTVSGSGLTSPSCVLTMQDERRSNAKVRRIESDAKVMVIERKLGEHVVSGVIIYHRLSSFTNDGPIDW